MKIILLFLFSAILLTGCEKPYSMLTEQEKVVRTFTDYVQALSEHNYEKAYNFLSFVHIQKGGNKNEFVKAQRIMDKMYSDINYEVTKLQKTKNVAVLDVSIIYKHAANNGKTKTETQVFLHKNGQKWGIVIGIFPVRMQLLKIYPSMKDHFILKKDSIYLLKDNKWINVEKLKKEKLLENKSKKNSSKK